MSAKQALKSAKALMDAKNFQAASEQFRNALELDPKNFTAHLYLGYSLFQLQNYDESEKSYKNALDVDEKYRKQPPAWQGLLNVYEAQKKVDKYIPVAEKIATLFSDGDDRARCAAVINKMLQFVKEHGTNEQKKQAWKLILPDHPLFDYLEGVIPRPVDTYLQLAEILEKEEKEKINKEIAARRSRLSATKGNINHEVKCEVFEASTLEDVYHNILNWSDSDEVRREIDEKLLYRGFEKLVVLPSEKKLEQRAKVWKQAEGIVILNHPLEPAWRLFIEWKDCENIAEYDVNVLRQYTEFFPESGLAIVIKAYLKSDISPFPVPVVEEKDEQEPEEEISPVQILADMTEGLAKETKSPLCHRIVGQYYLHVSEFESAVDACRKGKKLILFESRETGQVLQKNLDAVLGTLATALVHYESPQHHEEAKGIFLDLLKRNSSNSTALVGLGMILEEQQEYDQALDFLNRALKINPNDIKILSEASWCQVLMGNHTKGRKGLENCLELVTGIDAQSRELRAQLLWRIGTSIWNADEEGRSDRQGAYSYFMAALQSNNNYAPAYTSMGIYYADIMNDITRATKCFEKAFELSPGEVEAAERLAHMFAETHEWDLVEIIARRVAEADQKRSVPGKGMSWPQNAIGVVELNSQNYAKAIVAFQAALRASPKDFHSWVGLGEAYSNSGRHIAALKALGEAAKIDGENWLVKYMIANVHRELGDFDEACAGYREVLQLHPGEFGVLMALSESLVGTAESQIAKGYYGQASESIVEALNVSVAIVAIRPDAFSLWKNIGDACLLFTWIQSFADQFPWGIVRDLISTGIEKDKLNIMSEYDSVGSSVLDLDVEDQPLQTCIQMALLSFKRAIYVTADDRHAHSVAWYNLGAAEYRAYNSLSSGKDVYRSAAIRCFKRAIKVESGNSDFWNALGVCTAEINPRASQHALVRSLYINEKAPHVWTNLGTLYFLQNDLDLASEAFVRAQSIDPEYTYAWVGQGLVARASGDITQAHELFEHAFEISDGFAALAKREYATSMFDTIISVLPETSFTSLLAPIFALHKLEQQTIDEPAILHLNALLQERIGEFAKAASNLSTISAMYEEKYETTESEDDLIRYAQSMADLARMNLGLKRYPEAIEDATTALDLSADIPELESSRLSAHLTAGLAYYFEGDMAQSLEMFKVALEESGENPDVVALLSQVLWAKGGEEEKEAAREQLFNCIEKHPDHLPSILLLGSIGVLDQSEDVLEAVMDDLYSYRAAPMFSERKDQVDSLLAIAAKVQNKSPLPAITSSIFLRPAEATTWSALASLENDDHAAEMARMIAVGGEFSAEVVARALAGVGEIAADQRAIMIAPWLREGWEGLREDVEALKGRAVAGEGQKKVEEVWRD
ncbi:hypothetical protein DFH27DRAFT_516715 [Peziza echinospora]|nr:hypothetical protein DFH27DRAFT_516715 [Peziza echinospora]